MFYIPEFISADNLDNLRPLSLRARFCAETIEQLEHLTRAMADDGMLEGITRRRITEATRYAVEVGLAALADMVEQGRIATETDAVIDAFVAGYLECATWCGVVEGPNGEPESDPHGYSVDMLTDEATETARETCRDFIQGNWNKLEALVAEHGSTWERHGHDFYLTRCRHGAGFWDRGYPDILGDALTEACRPYGPATLGVELDADGEETLVWLES